MKTQQKLTLALAFLGNSFLMTSCIGDNICISVQGDEISETRTFNDFNELHHDFSRDVTIHFSADLAEPYAEISGSKNLVNNLKVVERGEKLIIEEDRCIRNSSDIHIDLYVSSLKEIDLDGSGTIYSSDSFEATELDINLDGSGEIDIKTDANFLNVDLNGSGEVYLDGVANTIDYNVRGSGDIEAFDFEAKEGDVKISGSGTAKVNVTEELSVKISGSGDVYYIGNPLLTSSITGSGSINKY